MQIAMLILLYDERPKESITIEHLLNSGVDLSIFNIVLWNNGPKVWCEEDYTWIKLNLHSATLAQTIENRPLSLIYNTFIDKFRAEKYVFLDDDSSLTLEYLKDIIKYNLKGVAIPVVTFKGEIGRPVVAKCINTGPYKPSDLVHMIGSGVVLGHTMAKTIKQKFGNVFDEEFAFYGVDTSLFIRLARLGMSNKITCIHGFEHSNSFLEEEEGEIKSFRKTEISTSLAINHRKNFRYFPKLVFIRTVISILLKKNQEIDLITYIRAYVQGKHDQSGKLFPEIVYSQCEELARVHQ